MANNSANAVSGAASGAAAGSALGPWGIAAGGALGLAGSIYGASSASKAAGASWKQQVLMAMFQRDWEKEKMQNAYQWTVADMEKAGLNPILATRNGANSGGGITAGAGDTSGLSSAGKIAAQGLANIIPAAISAYSGLKGTENQTTQTETDAILKKAEAAKTVAETKNLPEKMKSEILKNIADAEKTREQTKVEKAKGDVAENTSKTMSTVTGGIANIIEKGYSYFKNRQRRIRLDRSWSARQASLRNNG